MDSHAGSKKESSSTTSDQQSKADGHENATRQQLVATKNREENALKKIEAMKGSKKEGVCEFNEDEKDKKELAEARVKKFYDLLVSKGIDKERLVYKSYSDTRPTSYFSEKNGKWIENDKKSERNRRIDIGLLRRDYDPITKKPKVDPVEEKQLKEMEVDED